MQKHQHGGDIYTNACRMDYSANINPLGTPGSVISAAQAAVLQSANYPDVQCRKLRRAISEKEGVPVEQIICGNGAAELIFTLVRAVKPKRAVLMAPGFAEYEQALAAEGCEITYYDLKPENGFGYGEDYRELLTAETDMIFLCNPNNPTGIRMDRSWILEVLEICRRKKILTVLDSCFQDFLEDYAEADFSGSLKEYPNLFLLKAFTKTYAMAGLRLGYGMTSSQELLERMKEVMQPWSVSIPAQEAGTAALGEREFVEKTRALIRQQRAWLKERLKELGLVVYDSSANFIFFEAPEDFGKKCAEEGILIRDCSNYRGLRKGFYRIAVRTEKENEELIRVFSKVLEK